MVNTADSDTPQRKLSVAVAAKAVARGTSSHSASTVVAWAQEKCVFPSKTIAWVRTQRMSQAHGHAVPYLARYPASVRDSRSGRSEFDFSVVDHNLDEAAARCGVGALRNAARRQSVLSRSISEEDLIGSSTVSDGKENSSGQSATSSSRPLVHQRRSSTAGSWAFFTQLYGKDPYNKELAELGETESQDSIQYPTKSKRLVLLVSAIVPYLIVSYFQIKYCCR